MVCGTCLGIKFCERFYLLIYREIGRVHPIATNNHSSIMKYTIIGSMMAATLLVSCGDKKKEAENKGSDKDQKEQKTAPKPEKETPKSVKETPKPKVDTPEVAKETPKSIPAEVIEVPAEVNTAGEHSKISASLEGKTKVLKNGEFVVQDVSKKNDYYLVYFSASW